MHIQYDVVCATCIYASTDCFLLMRRMIHIKKGGSVWFNHLDTPHLDMHPVVNHPTRPKGTTSKVTSSNHMELGAIHGGSRHAIHVASDGLKHYRTCDSWMCRVVLRRCFEATTSCCTSSCTSRLVAGMCSIPSAQQPFHRLRRSSEDVFWEERAGKG